MGEKETNKNETSSGKEPRLEYLTSRHITGRIMAQDTLSSAHVIAKLKGSNTHQSVDASKGSQIARNTAANTETEKK
jgi:hypothetical protein